MSKQAAEKRAELAKLSGKAFDKAYPLTKPISTTPELKDLLAAGLKIFQGHEQHAEHVAAEVK